MAERTVFAFEEHQVRVYPLDLLLLSPPTTTLIIGALTYGLLGLDLDRVGHHQNLLGPIVVDVHRRPVDGGDGYQPGAVHFSAKCDADLMRLALRPVPQRLLAEQAFSAYPFEELGYFGEAEAVAEVQAEFPHPHADGLLSCSLEVAAGRPVGQEEPSLGELKAAVDSLDPDAILAVKAQEAAVFPPERRTALGLGRAKSARPRVGRAS